MLDEALFLDLANLVRAALGDPSLCVKPETTAEDVEGWDSFKHVEILLAAQAKYKLRFNSREIDGVATVGDLAALIARRQASARNE